MAVKPESISPELINQRIYGRYSAAQAALVRRLGGRLELAEDAMQDALVKALELWPQRGIPDDIVGWLVTTGMNAFRDRYRHESRGRELFDQLEQVAFAEEFGEGGADLEDDVLRLIFMCCHPSIAPENQLALTLKLVMGFSQSEVASALLIQERTLEQRLTRSKRKIATAGIDFALPDKQRLDDRLPSVQHALYLIFNEGYYGSSGTLLDKGVCRNAIMLCRSLCRLYPLPENMGLLALFLFQDSRAAARMDESGDLLTLEQQDRGLWQQSQIQEADVLLQKALRQQQSGTYQLQAAIAGVHSQAKTAAETDWLQIVGLYKLLLSIQPDAVVKLNYAVALMCAEQLPEAVRLLDSLGSELEQYSPYWAARARQAEMQGATADRITALETARQLAGSSAEIRHYQRQLEQLQTGPIDGATGLH